MKLILQGGSGRQRETKVCLIALALAGCMEGGLGLSGGAGVEPGARDPPVIATLPGLSRPAASSSACMVYR